MKKHKVTIIMITLFFIGLLTLFYPTLSNYYNEKNQSKTIYNYENILNEKNKIDFDKLKEDAINYNKELSELTEPLLSYENIQNYNELLNINNDGMFLIGAVFVVACGVIIPIILNEKVFKKYTATKLLFGLK